MPQAKQSNIGRELEPQLLVGLVTGRGFTQMQVHVSLIFCVKCHFQQVFVQRWLYDIWLIAAPPGR